MSDQPGADFLSMPTIQENYIAWNDRYDWPQDGDEWGRFDLPFFQRIRADFFDSFVTSSTAVLEIGPGHGRWTGALAERAGRVVLVDISEKNLAYCRERFKKFTSIEYIQCDGASLAGVPDESIDFVWSFNAFVHMEKPVIISYLKEIQRVLRPGGHCAFDHAGRNHLCLHFEFLNRFGSGGKKLYQRLSLGRRKKSIGDGWRSNVSAHMVRSAATDSGFSVLKHKAAYLYHQKPSRFTSYNDYLVLLQKPE